MNDSQEYANIAIAAVNLSFGYTKLSLDGYEKSVNSPTAKLEL